MTENQEILELRVGRNTVPHRLSMSILKAISENKPVALMGIGTNCVNVMIQALLEANVCLHEDRSETMLWTVPEYVVGDTPETTCVYLPVYLRPTTITPILVVGDATDPTKLLKALTKSLETPKLTTDIFASTPERLYLALKSLIYMNQNLIELESPQRAFMLPFELRGQTLVHVEIAEKQK